MSLARWAASRSLLHLRWNPSISTSRRLFSYVHPPSYQARPSTWVARIWYRKDGTPRSKVKGLVIGSVALLIYTAADILVDLEEDNLLLCKLVHIQRMDSEFSSLDLNDFVAVTDYFFSMVSLGLDEGSQTDIFNAFVASAHALTGEKREEFHAVSREAVENVHRILIDSKGQDPFSTAFDVLICLEEALVSAAHIVSNLSEDVRRIKAHVKKMMSKDRARKDGEYDKDQKDGEYEIVG